MPAKKPLKGTLIITRHHESEWNKLGLWTGSTDIGLSPYGTEMSEKMGQLLREHCAQVGALATINRVFLSDQKRTLQTYESMQKGIKTAGLIPNGTPIEHSAALNERDYGDFTGKNKWKVKEEIGDEAFERLRRGWDTPVPNGETLKMVYDRAVPYFTATILPHIAAGENVLVVSSGNAIRSLIKYIERIGDDAIGDIEMPFGAIIFYSLDEDGHCIAKDLIQLESHVNA